MMYEPGSIAPPTLTRLPTPSRLYGVVGIGKLASQEDQAIGGVIQVVVTVRRQRIVGAQLIVHWIPVVKALRESRAAGDQRVGGVDDAADAVVRRRIAGNGWSAVIAPLDTRSADVGVGGDGRTRPWRVVADQERPIEPIVGSHDGATARIEQARLIALAIVGSSDCSDGSAGDPLGFRCHVGERIVSASNGRIVIVGSHQPRPTVVLVVLECCLGRDAGAGDDSLVREAVQQIIRAKNEASACVHHLDDVVMNVIGSEIRRAVGVVGTDSAIQRIVGVGRRVAVVVGLAGSAGGVIPNL